MCERLPDTAVEIQTDKFRQHVNHWFSSWIGGYRNRSLIKAEIEPP
jgi:hypothetical protein